MGRRSWLRSLRYDCLRGQGQVQDEAAIVLVKPYVSLRVRVAGELAQLEVPVVPRRGLATGRRQRLAFSSDCLLSLYDNGGDGSCVNHGLEGIKRA
jgi:hypothetical protein